MRDTTLEGPYPNETTPETLSTPGTFDFDLTGLVPGKTYYFKAKADGGVHGTSLDGEKSFTTGKTPLSVTTNDATSITTNSATLNMSYTLWDYSSVDVHFAYKNAADAVWINTSWVSKAAIGTHAKPLTGLDSSTLYDFKAQLRYNSTEIQGRTIQFTKGTPPTPPPKPRASPTPPRPLNPPQMSL